MQIIKPYTEILAFTPDLEQVIELAGRVCYKSEDRITEDSASKFVCNLTAPKADGNKHESVLEHGSITVRFVCDRGISHELVRHRIASFSQESTRYCNYSKDKFGNEITVIKPCFFEEGSEDYLDWEHGCLEDEARYSRMLARGRTPQEARSILPNSLKTEVVVTANPREWRHIFQLRCAQTAHPQMRELMVPLAAEFASLWPSLFSAWAAA